MFAKIRRRFGIRTHTVHTVTTTREMTPEEAGEISARMGAAFAHMGEAFAEMDKAFVVVRAGGRSRNRSL